MSLQRLCLNLVPNRYSRYTINYTHNFNLRKIEFDKYPVYSINKFSQLIAYDIDTENKKVKSLLFFDSRFKRLFNATSDDCERLFNYIRRLDSVINCVDIQYDLTLNIGRLSTAGNYFRRFIDQTDTWIEKILFKYSNLRCEKCEKYNINISEQEGNELIKPFSQEIQLRHRFKKVFRNRYCKECTSKNSDFCAYCGELWHVGVCKICLLCDIAIDRIESLESVYKEYEKYIDRYCPYCVIERINEVKRIEKIRTL